MFFGVITHNVKGAETGTIQPTAEGVAYNEWTNGQNAYTQNDIYATGTTGTADENDYYNFGITVSNFYSVIGIVVSIDAYASTTLCSYKAKLSWNAGSTYTSVKQSNNLGTSDTDIYINIGGATDTWGHTWTENELSNANFRLYLQVYNTFSGRTIYTDHIYIYIYYKAYPSVPEYFYAVPVSCSKNVNLTWLCPSYNFDDLHDYVRVQRSTVSYPTNPSSGTNVCNITGSFYPTYIDTTTNYDTVYYYSAFAYNRTYALWCSTYAIDKTRTSCNKDLSFEENLINCTGTYEYTYKNTSGYKIFNNYTGDTTPIHTSDIKTNCSGYLSYSLNNTGYWVTSVHSSSYLINYFLENVSGNTNVIWFSVGGYWVVTVNYTGNTTICNSTDINLFENIINATGTLEYEYNSITGFKVWANYTGNTTDCPSCNSTDLILYENIINATGVHQSLYNPVTGWKVWANYTGNVSLGNCSGIYWYNYTDDNVTINVSFNKQTNSFIDDYTINKENWLNIAGALLLDNSQFFIIILLALWLFFISKYLEHKDVTVALMQFGLSIPLTIVISVISLSYAFGYIIVFLIPIISLVLLADGFFYSKRKR